MKQARFEKVELNQILQLYGVMVSQGLWKDYSISFLKDFVVFSIYRKNSDWALFSIKKTPKNSKYGRLTVLANWKLIIKKICDIKPSSFSPKPKVDSSLLLFFPKKDFYKIRDPKNLEKITRIFFNNRRKMIKKPFNQIFNGDLRILKKLKINLNLRPQNLDIETYYKLTEEYENLRS